MYGKTQWVGREVEGRYSDLMTYFVRELNGEGQWLDVPALNSYPHYYFTIEYMRQCTEKSKHLEVIRGILDKTQSAVTVEADPEYIKRLPHDLFNRCHVIYRIKDGNIGMLKKTDTLSLDSGWYRSHQITKWHLVEMQPDDYKFDLEEAPE